MRLSIRAVATSTALRLIVSAAAWANPGNDFASYTCGKTSNVPRFSGRNGSHGFLLDHNIFTPHGKDWDGDTSLSRRELCLRTTQEGRRKENLLRRCETIPVGTRPQVFLQVFSDLLAMKAAVLDKDLVGP
jgi:hypothetical protein